MSAGALLAAAGLFVALGLVGSRFRSLLAAPEDGALYRAALYVLGGTVLLHLLLTLLDFVRVPWNPFLLAALLALAAGLAHWLLPRGPQRAALPSDPGWGDGLTLFAVSAFTLVALTGWILMPDFIYHWGIKGYRFFLSQGVDYGYLALKWNWVVHPEYPNLVPELFAVSALAAGSFAVPAMMFHTSVLFLLLLACIREGLARGGAGRFVQQAGLALVALSTGAFGIGHIMAGAADWMMVLALAAAVPPLLRPPDRQGDWQLAVIAAFAAASKVEGVPLAALLATVQIARRTWGERRLDVPAALRAGLLPAVVTLAWIARAVHHRLFQPYNSGPVVLSRAGEIFKGVWDSLDNPAWHGFLPAIFLPPLLLLSRRTRAFAVVATLELASYFYVYFTAQVGAGNYHFFVLSNFARLGFQIIPASLVGAIVALRFHLEESKKQNPSPLGEGQG